MVRSFIAAALAVVAIGATQPATAAVTQVDGGGYSDLVPVSPGVYGVEAISGQRGNWQLGVGTQTSHDGTFNKSDKVDWSKGPFEFKVQWQKGKVTAKIGDVTVNYDSDWKIGDAIRIGTQGEAAVTISEVDGTKFNLSATGGKALYFAALDGFEGGWSLAGTITARAFQGSRDWVQVTTGNIAQTPIPAAALLFGTGIAGLGAFGRRFRKA